MDYSDDRISDLEMTSAIQGLQLDKETALRTLTDFKGNAIEFKEQKDGKLSIRSGRR